MFRRPLRRTLAILVVSLAFATPLCEAASAPGRFGRVSSKAGCGLDPSGACTTGTIPMPPPPLLPAFWDWLSRVWTKAGCSLDPGGACTPGITSTGPSAAPDALDEGCGLDPGGRTCGGHS